MSAVTTVAIPSPEVGAPAQSGRVARVEVVWKSAVAIVQNAGRFEVWADGDRIAICDSDGGARHAASALVNLSLFPTVI